ncbi:MAG: Abi family protein [Clostridiales bacterium]|nr:Abi family protein [Clostridiales bacterium]
MNRNNQATNVNEQIEILLKKGLIINNISDAKIALNTYGYYNIINSYKEPYTILDNSGNTIYKQNTTFDQIYSLFQLDHYLRNSIMVAMVDLEEHLRAVSAEVIAHSFGTNMNVYLDRKNYQNRKIKDPRFRLDAILASLKKIALENSSNPIKYYRDTYENIPPWVLFKGTYLSTLVNYIRLFKKEEKEVFIQKVFGIRKEYCHFSSIKNLLTDSLFLFLDYRNRTAHGGRVYNFIPKSTIRMKENDIIELRNMIQNPDSSLASPGIGQLLFVLGLYKYQSPYYTVLETLNSELNRHLTSYPSDISFIGEIFGILIEAEELVWVSNSSKIFHSHNHCGASRNLHQITKTEAFEQGYSPCQKCLK